MWQGPEAVMSYIQKMAFLRGWGGERWRWKWGQNHAEKPGKKETTLRHRIHSLYGHLVYFGGMNERVWSECVTGITEGKGPCSPTPGNLPGGPKPPLPALSASAIPPHWINSPTCGQGDMARIFTEALFVRPKNQVGTTQLPFGRRIDHNGPLHRS